MRFAMFILAAGAVVAGCAGNGYNAGSDEAGMFQTADGTEVECRRVKEMGTRLGKKVCMEPKEWEQADRAAEEGAEDFMNSASGAGRDMTAPGGIN